MGFYIVIAFIAAVLFTVGGFFIGLSEAEQTCAYFRRELIGRFGAAVSEAEDETQRLSLAYAYTGDFSDANIRLGEEYLSRYGYTADMKSVLFEGVGERSREQGLWVMGSVFAAVMVVFAVLTRGAAVQAGQLDRICADGEMIFSGGDYHEDHELSGALRRCSSFASRLSSHCHDLEMRLSNEKQKVRDMISDISHQMKTPVAAIKMNSELMLSEPLMEASLRESFLSGILEQTDRLEWLVSGLLKSARIDSGLTEFEMKRHRLFDAAEDAVNRYRAAAREKSITISNNVPEELELMMDIRWLSEAVGNLIGNSVEHTGRGGSVVLEGFETPLTCVLLVKDNGEGIPPENLSRIFDRFFSSGKNRSAHNVGIGLAVSKSIIERHDGSIRASSDGNGTVFTMTFLKKEHRG